MFKKITLVFVLGAILLTFYSFAIAESCGESASCGASSISCNCSEGGECSKDGDSINGWAINCYCDDGSWEGGFCIPAPE